MAGWTLALLHLNVLNTNINCMLFLVLNSLIRMPSIAKSKIETRLKYSKANIGIICTCRCLSDSDLVALLKASIQHKMRSCTKRLLGVLGKSRTAWRLSRALREKTQDGCGREGKAKQLFVNCATSLNFCTCKTLFKILKVPLKYLELCSEMKSWNKIKSTAFSRPAQKASDKRRAKSVVLYPFVNLVYVCT